MFDSARLQAILDAKIAEKKREVALRIVAAADKNWERLTKYFTVPVVIDSGVSLDGSTGYSRVESPYLGVQNRGAIIPERTPKKARALRFTTGGRGTLVRGSLNSVKPRRGTNVIFTKKAKAYVLPPGNWDRANKQDLLARLPEISKG